MAMRHVSRRGFMLVLSSPSGAGKSTISSGLLGRHPELTMSISATTRPMRPGEKHARDYLFVDQSEFDKMVLSGEMLEHAVVFGNSYGTPKDPVVNALNEGRDVLFDVDWQGTQQLRKNAPADVVSIFILPPSFDELERRLLARAQDTEEVMQDRMSRAHNEMSHWAEYEYIIINQEIEASVTVAGAILTAERYRRKRQAQLEIFVRGMKKPSNTTDSTVF
ncbi:MAG: guanylate kinase [Rhodospirillaceae bacterium TMED8]|nr:guanylate kinase [Magnetovibrio sp.]OUT50842.1 MAG: guanylate kinase [Rhodospirillaceae bacterium TMED8]|tara:strand:+ start:5564 stop:6226 length:663 start_codon:yes stop_codon:yes gene_type:complete